MALATEDAPVRNTRKGRGEHFWQGLVDERGRPIRVVKDLFGCREDGYGQKRRWTYTSPHPLDYLRSPYYWTKANLPYMRPGDRIDVDHEVRDEDGELTGEVQWADFGIMGGAGGKDTARERSPRDLVHVVELVRYEARPLDGLKLPKKKAAA